MTPTRLTCLALFALSLTAAPVLAQDDGSMTAEEIQNAFQKQKTRGLVVVPTTGGESATAQTGSDAATEVTSATYQAVTPEEQVNVRIAFDFDSAALRDDQKPQLATVCEVMKGIDVAVFQIIGHTDASGSADYNKTLSQLRAEEVKRHLVDECGISADRLQAIGMGETVPYDENDPRSDVNRRVEFQALG